MSLCEKGEIADFVFIHTVREIDHLVDRLSRIEADWANLVRAKYLLELALSKNRFQGERDMYIDDRVRHLTKLNEIRDSLLHEAHEQRRAEHDYISSKRRRKLSKSRVPADDDVLIIDTGGSSRVH
jgi:hypothetical protein